jgi:hypothetical protein
LIAAWQFYTTHLRNAEAACAPHPAIAVTLPAPLTEVEEFALDRFLQQLIRRGVRVTIKTYR